MAPNPLSNQGSRRDRRTPPGLPPTTVDLFGHDEESLLAFLSAFGAKVRYHGAEAGEETSWSELIGSITRADLAPEGGDGGTAPHAALLIAFLRLFLTLRPDLNGLVARHLDYYYGEILGTRRRPALPDRVHLLAEPGKKTAAARIDAGSLVESGDVAFETLNDVTVTGAKIVHLHQLFSPRGELPRYATEAASIDGRGEPLADDFPFWPSFGGRHLEVAPLGFAVASPALAASEGTRMLTVRVDVAYDAPLVGDLSSYDLSTDLCAYLSGEDDWLGPYRGESGLSAALENPRDDRSRWTLTLSIELGDGDDAVALYDPERLPGGFDTVAPVLKIELASDARPERFALLRDARVEALQVLASVTGVEDLVMENDQGRLDPSKPFMPFGPAPVVGSTWYIGSSEIFGKNVTSYELELKWMDLPGRDHYASYPNHAELFGPANDAEVSLVRPGLDVVESGSTKLFSSGPDEPETKLTSANLSPPGRYYATLVKHYSRQVSAARLLLQSRARLVTAPLRKTPEYSTFGVRPRPRVLDRTRLARRRRESALDQEGHIRVSLSRDFGHASFPRLYTEAALSASTLPNAAYTPLLEYARLDYRAETALIDPRAGDPLDREVQLFHLTPFGQAEQHSGIKAAIPHARSDRIALLSDVGPEGQLLLGLAGAAPGEALDLLFEVASDSADPEAVPPAVKWSALSYNEWLPLSPVRDTSHGLRRPGIVTLILPPELNDDNSLLEPGIVWLRATVAAGATTMAQTEFVGTQAVGAKRVLEDDKATFELLAPDQLGKLRTEIRGVKKIAQPFGSFGGRAHEALEDYRTRVSERLRHRGRAIAAWDYERLVLERFPEIHTARCIPHHDRTGRAAANHVSLVVIPIRHASSHSTVAPMADLDTLASIESFASGLAPSVATVAVTNPLYVPVSVEAEVRFKLGTATAEGTRRLEEVLARFFAPWAFAGGKRPEFGGSLYASEVIALIDSLVYVDAVRGLRLRLEGDDESDPFGRQYIAMDDGRSILTSGSHTILPFAESSG